MSYQCGVNQGYKAGYHESEQISGSKIQYMIDGIDVGCTYDDGFQLGGNIYFCERTYPAEVKGAR